MNTKAFFRLPIRVGLVAIFLIGGVFSSQQPARAANQIDIVGPSGSVRFGTGVTVLPNGNIVVTDPSYDGGIGPNAGAVYLYDGRTGERISMLTGMNDNDLVGSGGVSILSNGNYIVKSPKWNGSRGAVTWGSQTSGISGAISTANSLVGSTPGDQVGSWTKTFSNNNNYLVLSWGWDNGAAVDAGAATWGDGATGTSGVISSENSLVGSTSSDWICDDAYELENGDYVVVSSFWDNEGTEDVGAVTQADGTTGIRGLVSETNSLVGSQAGDQVGHDGLTILKNGNYLVSSPYWDNGTAAEAGAVTWVDYTTGLTGEVSPSNSLVGSSAGDRAGYWGTWDLENGNYVVVTSEWDNGAIPDAGAVTWGNGSTRTAGPISVDNSLVGSQAGDRVGETGITPLANGNYIVRSAYWDNGSAVDAGAVTWVNGFTLTTGNVSADNSLVGTSANDHAGKRGIQELSNGNYLVLSPEWDNASETNAGAVTWGNGNSGISGPISVDNSLIGTHTDDQIGLWVTTFPNGNYTLNSPYWDNSEKIDAGANTWGNGSTKIRGPVSSDNSLVGTSPQDYVGYATTVLKDGKYAIYSSGWDNGGIADVGAITWGSGTTGITGPVTTANSLVGSSSDDHIGDWQLTVLNNGNYVLPIPRFDSGGVIDVGAVIWINGANLPTGVISPEDSLVGSTEGDLVGYSVIPLGNNYLMHSREWDNGAAMNAGAVTWGDGSTGISGVVSAANSLVGSTTYDQIGGQPDGTIFLLENGNYVVFSPHWDNGPTIDAGAVTWGYKNGSTLGPITAEKSVFGTTQSGGKSMVYQFDPVNYQLVVGRPYDNIVTLFKPQRDSVSVYLPLTMK